MANRLKEIYDELRAEGVVTTQKDFAQMLEIHYTTLSAAMNGKKNVLNPKLIARAEQFLKNIHNPAVAKTGGCGNDNPHILPHPSRGIVIPQETMELYTNLSRTAAQLAETLDRLLSGETKKGAV